jgi:hypothetical protein
MKEIRPILKPHETETLLQALSSYMSNIRNESSEGESSPDYTAAYEMHKRICKLAYKGKPS